MTKGDFVAFCHKLTIGFICCLPFLVPFGDAPRNIDMQGLILLLAGSAGWAAVLARQDFSIHKPRSLSGKLLVVFMLACLLSLLVNPHFGYDLFGAPYIRLGTGGLLACIGCGLALKQVARKQLVIWLYVIICALALVAVPYGWLHLHSLTRIGSLFAQADIFAVFLGCGLLLGTQLILRYKTVRKYLLVGQAILFLLLVLSGTRVILFLVLLLLPLYWQQMRRHRITWRWLVYVGVVVLLLVVGRSVLPQRITNISYANESIRYRLDLQIDALQATRKKPVLGYGPGNLADALDCPTLSAASLQKTCHDHYFFNSSHNIFLDRVLAVGWLGGLAFLWLVILAIYRGFRGTNEYRVFAYALVLIGCYYLTNITSAVLELLFWILLLQCLSAPIKNKRQP